MRTLNSVVVVWYFICFLCYPCIHNTTISKTTINDRQKHTYYTHKVILAGCTSILALVQVSVHINCFIYFFILSKY